MSSYQPLADHLARIKADVWDASFEDVERALGRPLPQSAYRHNAWWANQTGPGHSQTHGWRSVGWRTAKLDLERRFVRFEKVRGLDPTGAIEAMLPAQLDQALLTRAKEIGGFDDDGSAINAALRVYIEQAAIDAVIAMGGSSPGFQAAPRERP